MLLAGHPTAQLVCAGGCKIAQFPATRLFCQGSKVTQLSKENTTERSSFVVELLHGDPMFISYTIRVFVRLYRLRLRSRALSPDFLLLFARRRRVN